MGKLDMNVSKYYTVTEEDLIELGFTKLNEGDAYYQKVPVCSYQYILSRPVMTWDGNYKDETYKPIKVHVFIREYNLTKGVNGITIWGGYFNCYCGMLKFVGDVESKKDFVKLLKMLHAIEW